MQAGSSMVLSRSSRQHVDVGAWGGQWRSLRPAGRRTGIWGLGVRRQPPCQPSAPHVPPPHHRPTLAHLACRTVCRRVRTASTCSHGPQSACAPGTGSPRRACRLGSEREACVPRQAVQPIRHGLPSNTSPLVVLCGAVPPHAPHQHLPHATCQRCGCRPANSCTPLREGPLLPPA